MAGHCLCQAVAHHREQCGLMPAHKPDRNGDAWGGGGIVAGQKRLGRVGRRRPGEDVDVAVPYAAGELLARVRERGTVALDYRERDVRVSGRVNPGLAGELRATAERWADSLAEASSEA